jgi:uncharacterized protein YgiM (DUF1202 family)
MKKLLGIIIGAALVVALLFGAVPTSLAQASPTATVNTGALHVRSGPGIGYNVVFSLNRGVAMTMTARNAEATWVKIVLDNGIVGWVSAPYILTAYPITSLPVEGSLPSGGNAVVYTGALNVRSGPGITFSVVTSLYNGTTLTLLSRNWDGSWVKVVIANGTQGWVNSSMILASVSIFSLPLDSSVTPAPSPVPQPQPQPQPSTYRTHVVQAGENLYRISLTYGVNMYAVAQLNGIVNLGLVYVGQVLLIPW